MRKKKGVQELQINDEVSVSAIGILSFEVANTMSRVVRLHRSLSDGGNFNLRQRIISSPDLHFIISPCESYLVALAVAEKLDELNRVAAATSRLGFRCSVPALQGFEHVYTDLLTGRIDPSTLGFLYRDIESIVRKMERFAASTAALYTELETLNELELSIKKFPPTPANLETRNAIDQRIQWQRDDVKQLRDSSLWNQSYDKVALLLASAVCTIHNRIYHVFADSILDLENLMTNEIPHISGQTAAFCHFPLSSDLLSSAGGNNRKGKIQKTDPLVDPVVTFHHYGLRLKYRDYPVKFFRDCLCLCSFVSWTDKEVHIEEQSWVRRSRTFSLVSFYGKQGNIKGRIGKPCFDPKIKLTKLAHSSTVGGSALALHYANVIIIIEKLLRYPHLIGEEAKNDLYQMLPSSLRTALKKNLKSHMKDLAIYDASLAHDWKEVINKTLRWLAPMAHKMIFWQAERNFEEPQIVLREGVLLIQTLYFADREKTEAAICQILVGLNYICRYEHQQNALLDCTSSLDLDNGDDWQI